MPSLRDLFTAKTRDEVLETILTVADEVGLPVTAWQPLEAAREIFEIVAVAMSQYTQVGFVASASKLLTFATGQWLSLTTSEDYETDRIEATYATGTVRITNRSNVSYNIDPGVYHFLNDITGKTYSNNNTSTVTLPVYSGSGAFPFIDISIIADEPGSGSNAAIGDIASFVTPLPDVDCTNTTTFVGNDEETDEALRDRARAGNARLSPNGPKDAYDYFSKSALREDGTNVGVTRTRIYQPFSNRGNVSVYLASATGPVPGYNSDFTTDVGRVQLNLLENCVPTGIIVSAVSAQAFGILINANIYLKANSVAQPTLVKAAVLSQLSSYFASLPIGGVELVSGSGGFVFLDAIIDQIYNAYPQDIVHVVITNTSTDFILAINQVPVLASTDGSFNVIFAAA